MNKMEKIEDQFITSCETALSKEGKEICKEVDQLIKDDKKFDIDKAQTYCSFCSSFKKDVMDEKLYERCKKYLDEMRNYREIIHTLEHISRSRKMV